MNKNLLKQLSSALRDSADAMIRASEAVCDMMKEENQREADSFDMISVLKKYGIEKTGLPPGKMWDAADALAALLPPERTDQSSVVISAQTEERAMTTSRGRNGVIREIKSAKFPRLNAAVKALGCRANASDIIEEVLLGGAIYDNPRWQHAYVRGKRGWNGRNCTKKTLKFLIELGVICETKKIKNTSQIFLRTQKYIVNKFSYLLN